MPPHNKRESPNTGRPQNVRIRSCFCSSFHNTLVNRAQFIHMIGLVWPGTGIHERKQTCYQQRGFVMAYRIGPGKYGAGFSVFSVAVAEKQWIRSRITFPQDSSLTDKTFFQIYVAFHNRSGRYDKVNTIDTVSYVYRIVFVSVNTTVNQCRSSFNDCVITNGNIFQCSWMADSHIVANNSFVWRYCLRINLNQLFHTFYQPRPMSVKSHNICKMSCQLIIDRHFTTPGLI